MNLQDFWKDSKKFGYLVFGSAAVFLLLFLIFFGVSWVLLFVALLWSGVIFSYTKAMSVFTYTYKIGFVVIAVLVTLCIFAWAYSSPMVRKNFGTKKAAAPKLETCTSTASTPVKAVAGMLGELYSGEYNEVKGSPEPKDDTNVKIFSLKGIQDKTEKNSFYFQMSKPDRSSIKGYDDLIEVCNQDNKGSSTYLTRNASPNGVVKDDDVIARIAYFHGGKYILEPGVYRVDGYIRDLDGNWVLVAREEGITITE